MAYNLPPGTTMSDVDGQAMPKCARCEEEVNKVNDVGLCEDCETEMETECKRCHNQYELRFGEEPTDYCDHCAHIVAAELRSAIEAHRLQKADDRCIEDDDRLYEALGDGIKCDRRVGDKAAMLQNCKRFIERRCEGGGWPSYAELERRVAALEAELSPIK